MLLNAATRWDASERSLRYVVTMFGSVVCPANVWFSCPNKVHGVRSTSACLGLGNNATTSSKTLVTLQMHSSRMKASLMETLQKWPVSRVLCCGYPAVTCAVQSPAALDYTLDDGCSHKPQQCFIELRQGRFSKCTVVSRFALVRIRPHRDMAGSRFRLILRKSTTPKQ